MNGNITLFFIVIALLSIYKKGNYCKAGLLIPKNDSIQCETDQTKHKMCLGIIFEEPCMEINSVSIQSMCIVEVN